MSKTIFMSLVVKELRKNKSDSDFGRSRQFPPKMNTCLGSGNCQFKKLLFSFHLLTKREKEAKRENRPLSILCSNMQAKVPANRYILVKGKVFSWTFHLRVRSLSHASKLTCTLDPESGFSVINA